MKKIFHLILFFIIPLFFYGQDIVSLQKDFKNALSDSDTTFYILSKKIVNYYKNSFPDSAVYYLNKAIYHSQKKQNKNLTLKLLLLKADVFTLKQQYNHAVRLYFDALRKTSTDTTSEYAKILILLAKSMFNFNLKNGVSDLYLHKAIDISIEINDFRQQANAYNFLSLILAEKNKFDSALFYTEKAKQVSKNINDNDFLSNNFYYLSRIFLYKQDFIKSITYLKKAISLVNNKDLKHKYLQKLAHLYSKMGHFSSAKNVFDEIEQYYKKNNNKIGLIELNLLIAKMYYFQQKYNKAINKAQKALDLSQYLNIVPLQVKAYYLLSAIYSDNQQIDLALYSYKKYSALRDSIFTENAKDESDLLFNNYVMQLKLKDQEILNNQRKYQVYKNKQQKKIIYILSIFGILLVVSLTILFWLYRLKIKNELRLKQLTEATFEGIIIHNGHKIIEVNDKFSEISGFSREECIGLKIMDILPKESQKLVKKKLNLKKTVFYQMQMLKKDGSTYNAEVLSKPFVFKGINSKVVSIRDLSEISEIKEELYQTQEKFQALIETSPDGVVITDNKGKITYVSPAFIKLFQMSNSNQFLGKHISDFVAPLYRNKIKVDLNNILYGDYFGVTEYKAFKSDNKEMYIECNGNALRKLKGKASGVFMIVRDVTERKIVENTLIDSESRFRGLFNNAKDAIIILNSQFRIVDANPYSSELLKFSYEELLRMDFRDILAPELRNFDYDNLDKTGNILESYIYLKNRKQIYIQVSIAKLNYTEEQYYMLTIRDLTLFKRQEENLRKIANQLKESNATKDKIFSIIGHDLRGPIGNLKAMIEFIAENPNEFDTNELIETISSLQETSTQTYELLENLLSWAKTQQNLHEFSPSEFNILNIVKTTVNFSKQMAKAKNISIKISSPDNLYVIADVNMIKAVIRNLISNAIKFTKTNGKIFVKLNDDVNFVTVMIQDNGVGIPEKNLEKLFKEGSYLTTYGTNKEKGTGLGLKLCYDFIKKNSGKIWVESEINKGTTFYFTLKKI